ncbi:MAG: hypothetical protein RQ722_08220, partial [Desulfuromonadales bacterium]|nr:hypothetical protein [Desulfuromonadales bacterium]
MMQFFKLTGCLLSALILAGCFSMSSLSDPALAPLSDSHLEDTESLDPAISENDKNSSEAFLDD